MYFTFNEIYQGYYRAVFGLISREMGFDPGNFLDLELSI